MSEMFFAVSIMSETQTNSRNLWDPQNRAPASLTETAHFVLWAQEIQSLGQLSQSLTVKKT